mgnify:CR=1 FL=1
MNEPRTYLPHAVPVLEVGELLQHVVKRRQIHLEELVEMLVVPRHLQVVVSSYHTLHRRQHLHV